MKLNLFAKLFLPIVIVSFFVAFGLYEASTLIIIKSFQSLEDSSATQNAERAADAFANQANQLKVKDWSNWDDTYAFTKNHNQTFIDSNLTVDGLANLGLDYMLFYDANGKLVEGKHIDVHNPDQGFIPLESDILNLFSKGSSLLQFNGLDDTHKGFAVLPDGYIVILASRPILQSSGEGPPRGAMVFLQYVDAALTQNLGDITHLSVEYSALNKHFPSQPSPLHTGDYWINYSSKKNLEVYKVVSDIYGKPTLVTKVSLDRSIRSLGTTATNYYLIIIFCILIIATLLGLLGLYTLVLKRISRLATQLNAFEKFDNTAVPQVSELGGDEIGQLAKTINSMLTRLYQALSFQQLNVTLEAKVAERTKELDDQLSAIQRMNKVMINRELRIKALKEENIKLKNNTNPPATSDDEAGIPPK